MLRQELYSGTNSVVNSAESTLVVTGSRSRETAYLKAIEEKISNSSVNYVRILVGNPHHKILDEHIKAMMEMANSVKGWPEDKICIVNTPYGAEWPERFICANEKKAIIIIQSLNSPHAYDTGVIIDDPHIAIRLVDQLKAKAEDLHRKTLAGTKGG